MIRLLLRKLSRIGEVKARLLNTSFPVTSGTFGFSRRSGWKRRVIAAADKPSRIGPVSSETGKDQAGGFVAPADRNNGPDSSEFMVVCTGGGCAIGGSSGLHQLPLPARLSRQKIFPSGEIDWTRPANAGFRDFSGVDLFFGRGRFAGAGWLQANFDHQNLLRKGMAVGASPVPMSFSRLIFLGKRNFSREMIFLRRVIFPGRGRFP
jgi:hypothetical protein